MSFGKRKRYSKDVKCIFFPDDVKDGVRKVGRETSLSATSAAKCWERCGDSFQFLDTPEIKNLKPSGSKFKLSAVRKLAQSPVSAHTSTVHCNEDPVHIAWSSSESEQSDSEAQKQVLPLAQQQQQQGPWRPERRAAPIQSYSRALRMLSTEKEDLPVIDTDSDLSDSEVEVEKGSGGQISDCESASESCDEKPKHLPPQTTTMTELEISDYASDGENADDTMNQSRLETGSFPLQTGEGSRRSVSDWVRSAQAMLQTPQKQADRKSKTPEDSNKKKRKFQSGGLAERLNRLQCRQRSAISFWRHQLLSDTSTLTVDRPGVLVLEVLSVQEECSMQLAQCEQHRPPCEDHHSPPLPTARARVLVLFNKETAAVLMPAPRDIVYVYPPWQSLVIEGENGTIILNTHFSQKVCSASKLANASIPRALLPVEKCTPYSLTRVLGLLEINKTSEEGESTAKGVATPLALHCPGAPGGVSRHCDSLLEAIEGLGQAGSVGQDVEVVVQRVYSIPVQDRSAGSILKSKAPCRAALAPPLQKGKSRLCVLVQDSYGMFSIVQLHLLPCEDHLHQYSIKWQGRTCVLRAIKVVQRVTRERCTRLFNLIDSLWPPLVPLKVHGDTPSCPSESRATGPAPSFCYLLSGQESSVEPIEEHSVSPLYLPPTQRTLRDILQSELQCHRCSFVATVLYTRMERSDLGQSEVWLVLTDPSLQEEQLEGPHKRTLALCVSTSCVLTSSLVKALNSLTTCRLLFRDAVREHGGLYNSPLEILRLMMQSRARQQRERLQRYLDDLKATKGALLCVEQTVVQLHCVEHEGSIECLTRPELPSQSLTQTHALPQPLRLDPLGPDTTPNSLCTLTGVIVGVDENTAYSWPVCSQCGSDRLELAPERAQAFCCVSCDSTVEEPTIKMQLEVFLSSSLSNCTVKVKLQQNTILSVLNSAACEPNEFPGYAVENVLGKEVGPLTAYVRVVTRKPALWMGLEEICL